MEIDPSRSGAGNTHSAPAKSKSRQSPLRKNHFFTYNNYPKDEIDPIVTTLKKFAYKGKIQSEIGANGTPHLQGMIWCTKKCRDTEFKLSNKIHWEALKDELNIRDYCAKDETFDGFFRTEWGFPKPIKIIENLYPWQQVVENIFKGPISDRVINWFYDEEGNKGKSAFVKYMVIKHKALFCDGGRKSDLINLIFNNNMDQCNCIIWDLPRASKGNISYATLEAVKNGLICNTKYETGVKAFNSPHVFVFANFRPENEELLSKDRWNIKELGDLI